VTDSRKYNRAGFGERPRRFDKADALQANEHAGSSRMHDGKARLMGSPAGRYRQTSATGAFHRS